MADHDWLASRDDFPDHGHTFHSKLRSFDLFDRLPNRIEVVTVVDRLRLFIAEQYSTIDVDNQNTDPG